MSVIVHLSDLHLLSGAPEQDAILTALLGSLERERSRRGRPVDLVVVSGDLFETGGVDPLVASNELAALLRCIDHALGRPTPTLLVPGNHDRRRIGLFGPHRSELFCTLKASLPPHVFVHGCDTPFLGKVVPHDHHGQPFLLVAYDSTYLPSGYLSAGGVVRSEDLLKIAAEIADADPSLPVLFVLHHHLVPTPLTDLGPIETHRLPPLAHFALHRVLPVLVAHADREELTMTALGAGSALSMLHALGRAVLVLHGHKHVATARKLDRVHEGDGDVLLTSAGSGGTAQGWTASAVPDAARLWPSYNVLELEGDALAVETVSFGYKGRSASTNTYRPLVWAERRGAEWSLAPVPNGAAERVGPELVLDESIVTLRPSVQDGRWDAEIVRRIDPCGTRSIRRYVESIEGVADGRAVVDGEPQTVPARVEIRPGVPVHVALRGTLLRTWHEAARVRGVASAPYEHVSLMNRYRSARARLVLRGLGEIGREAFGSRVDLGTGEQRPVALRREGHAIVLEIEACPPRTLLRIHFPLA